MICNNCKQKNRCKINQVIKDTGVYLSINNCEHYTNKSTSITYENNKDFFNLKNEKGLNATFRQSRALNDVSELSNKIRLQEEAKKKGVTPLEINSKDLVKCTNCGDEGIMILHCSTCSKEICPSCAAVDLSDVNIIMCEECHDNTL